MKLSVPFKVLYDCEGLQLTVETDINVISGKLIQVDDCMNLTLDDAIISNYENEKTKVDRIFIRGAQIQFIILPPILKYSPYLQNETKPIKS